MARKRRSELVNKVRWDPKEGSEWF
jgi:hypothetical protein